MVGHILSLNNVGQFDAVALGAQLPFAPMTILYADDLPRVITSSYD